MKGIAVGDIHFGIKDSKRLYNELDLVRNYLDQNDLDLVVLNGDYFDRKISLTEPAAFYAITFFDQLVMKCKEKKIKLRMIQGTRSHDLNQLSIFSHYLSEPNLDFKIYETIAEEDIDGYKFLFIPEEYPENSEEYYKSWKQNKYNIIFGHGTWSEVAFQNQIELAYNNSVNSAPVFMYRDWKDALEHGVAIFGHIHSRNVFGKKIYYSGSFTRWNYGERSERGFTKFEIDPLTDEVRVEFVNNNLAPKYDVYALKDHFKDFSKVSVDELKNFIDELLKNTDNLRVDFSGVPEDKLLVLKNSFKGNENLKIEVRDSQNLLEANKETESAIYNKYAYILKRELPVDETVKRFIKEEYDKDVSLDDIRNILTVKQG